MSFIDDGLAEDDRRKRRAAFIEDHAHEAYTDLWTCVEKYIDEARTKGFKLFIEGGPYNRVVEIQFTPPTKMVRQRESIKLTGEGEQIKAKGERSVDFVFDLDAIDDHTVGLKHEGNSITAEAAAVLIMKRFLFPGQ